MESRTGSDIAPTARAPGRTSPPGREPASAREPELWRGPDPLRGGAGREPTRRREGAGAAAEVGERRSKLSSRPPCHGRELGLSWPRARGLSRRVAERGGQAQRRSAGRRSRERGAGERGGKNNKKISRVGPVSLVQRMKYRLRAVSIAGINIFLMNLKYQFQLPEQIFFLMNLKYFLR